MGLFDKLLKKVTDAAEKGVSKAIKDAVKDGLDGLGIKDEGDLEKAASQYAANVQQSAESYAAEVQSAAEDFTQYNRTPLKLVKEHKEPVQLAYDAVGSYVTDTGSIMYFTDLVQKNLPEYAVLQYPTIASVLGSAPEKNVNITMLLSKDGVPKLAIFLVSRDKYKPRALIESMNACENAGIPAIRFIQEFENRPEYVVGRIRTVLNAQ